MEALHDAAPEAVASDGVVAIGASAGGVEALKDLAAALPPDLPFAVMLTLHIAPAAPSMLAAIIDRSGPLPAAAAIDGAALEAGHIYVAPPDHHLLAHDHRVALTVGPWENGHRPAINALFRSVALDYGPRAIGVLLSGLLDDGVAGLAAIRDRGGITIVQEPSDALFPDLPRNAVNAGVAQHTVIAHEIGGLLKQLANRDIEEPKMERDGLLGLENRIAMSKRFAISFDPEDLGPPTAYTCPNCKGTLMAVGGNTYQCPVGHAWSAEALLFARDEELGEAVSVAVRILREKAKLSHQFAESAGPETRNRYAALSDEAEHMIAVLAAGLSENQPNDMGPAPVTGP